MYQGIVASLGAQPERDEILRKASAFFAQGELDRRGK